MHRGQGGAGACTARACRSPICSCVSGQHESSTKSAKKVLAALARHRLASLVQVAFCGRIPNLQQQPYALLALRCLLHTSISSVISLSLGTVAQTRAKNLHGAVEPCFGRPQYAKAQGWRTSRARCLHKPFTEPAPCCCSSAGRRFTENMALHHAVSDSRAPMTLGAPSTESRGIEWQSKSKKQLATRRFSVACLGLPT